MFPCKASCAREQTNGAKTAQHFTAIMGILLCTTAIIFYWHGSYTFAPLEYHILTMPIFTAAPALILFNLETLRQLVFPILFLFFLTPIPEELLFKLSNILSTTSSLVSSSVANVLGAICRLNARATSIFADLENSKRD